MSGPATQGARTPDSVASQVAHVVSCHRFTVLDERPLQDELERLFQGMGIPFEREAVLLGQDRVDFLFDQGVAVEVKVRGSVTDVIRQLWRYAGSERVARLVLVTTLERHRAIPRVAHGKLVRVVRASWL